MSAYVGNDSAVDESGSLGSEHLRARIAWYYYVAGQTQQEISEHLGIGRARVNRIVGQLRADGSVVVDIRLPLVSCVELEERLRTRFGLKAVAVVPAADDDEQQRRMLGDAAGVLLDELIAEAKCVTIGWGRTLSASIKRMRGRRMPNCTVVSLMGGLTRGSETNTFEVSTELAKTLGAECYYLTAPVYSPSPQSRDILLTHSGVNEVMARARSADLAIVSCGDLTPRTRLTSIRSVQQRLAELSESGAIGEILGTFIDATGQPVAHDLNRSVIALPPADLRTIPSALLISGGLHKARIISAVLTARYVNCLVTDENVARAILAGEEARPGG